MRIFRVRLGVRDFAEVVGALPSCLLKIKTPTPEGIRSLLIAAFADDPILSKKAAVGDYELKEIDLTVEGVD